VVGFRFSGRLTRGPAVRVTDRRHSLRLDILTSTRSTYVQVRCAVVALWSEHYRRYAHRIRPASTKLDSFLPTSSDIAWLASPLLLVQNDERDVALSGDASEIPTATRWDLFAGFGGSPVGLG
jgi:hypothetical protein